MNDFDEQTPDHQPKRRGNFLSLSVILVIGWIIYEVTHNPGMAAMAMCLKFGWEDFRTARWLNQTDPDRSRGRACSWLYVAAGLWQVAFIGVAMMILTEVLCESIQIQGAANRDVISLLTGVCSTAFVGLLLSTLCTYIALGSARRHGIRPWLNGSVHFARRRQEWPPLYGHGNRIMILVLTTLVVTFTMLVPAAIAIGAKILENHLGRDLLHLIILGSVLFAYMGMLPAAIVMIVRMRQWFFATHPADCWGLELLSAHNPEADEDEFA